MCGPCFVYQDGKQYGDEYLAELDYIEVVEGAKAGYESSVDNSDSTSVRSAASNDKPTSARNSNRSRSSVDYDVCIKIYIFDFCFISLMNGLYTTCL